MFALLLCAFTIVSTANTLIVCRNDGQDHVTCPDDFYCCHQDMCCKVYFARDDDDDDDDEDTDVESRNSWLEAFGLRTVVVCVFMVLLLLIAKSVQYFRKYYWGKNEEENLPRYFPLDKNIVVPDVNSISVLIGTPLYHVNSESLTTFGNPGGIPI